MRQIHCLNNISARGTDLLGADYALTDDIAAADGILVRSAAMHDLEFSDKLLAIARAGAGVNNIPLDRCADAGIVVFNTPGANANAVKELIIASLLLGSRGIVEGIEWVRDNADDPNITKSVEKAKKQFAGREIQGKSLGVIGLGAIGALVANAALDLGMTVYGYDPFVSVGAAWRLDPRVVYVEKLEDLLAASDYATIHVPATSSTIGMIDEAAVAAMKDGSVFLNFSRDTLVVTDALATALESGKVARYITDFATPEVVKLPNTIVVPHLGASTAEAEENCAVMAVNQTVAYLERGAIVNSVNFPACDPGALPAAGTRVCVLHAAEGVTGAAVAGALEGVGGAAANLVSKTRGARAYTVVDLPQEVSAEDAAAALAGLEGIYRVRAL